MIDKILRLGFTETTLLFIFYLENVCHYNINKQTNDLKINMIKWLYSTSGYYDNTVVSKYMDAKHTSNDTIVYNKYFNTLLEFIKDSTLFNYGIHEHDEQCAFFKFLDYLNYKKFTTTDKQLFFSFIKSKKILFISPFSELFKQQYDNGNCIKINNEFINLINPQFYTNGYTFFNNGPHNNILETAEYIYTDISNNFSDYDGVVISCGAYSNILAKYFYDNSKHVFTIGGELPHYFGILNERYKKCMDYKFEHLDKNAWIINIPEKYKPIDYMKIEDGCYW